MGLKSTFDNRFAALSITNVPSRPFHIRQIFTFLKFCCGYWIFGLSKFCQSPLENFPGPRMWALTSTELLLVCTLGNLNQSF